MKNNATQQNGSLEGDSIGQELIAFPRGLRPFPAPIPTEASDVLPALSLLAMHVLCDCAALDFCRGDQQLSVQQTVIDSSPAGAMSQSVSAAIRARCRLAAL